MYQRKVDVGPCSTRSLLYKVLALKKDTNARNVRANTLFTAYPHQPYVDKLYVLSLLRPRQNLVLTGTSIP